MESGLAGERPLTGVRLSWASRDRWRRITRAVIAALVAAVVLRIIGVPHMDLHGPLHRLGVMDPLCGGTRATFLLMSGHPGEAATYNPIVFPLAVFAVLVVLRAAAGWITGRWLDVRLSSRSRRILIAICVLALVALEVRQQLHASLLMQAWS